MLEVGAAIGIAAVGALWKMAFDQGFMRNGMQAILNEVKLLREDLQRDIQTLEDNIKDHEYRIRSLEKH